jgi:isoquinoline 1-oxidoreductase beta subunit
MGYLIAAPTVVGAAQVLAGPPAAQASIPTVQLVDAYDLSDLLTNAAMGTFSLMTVAVNKDGTVHFALPRAEVGQGLTTAFAMIIADEMDANLDQVNVTLQDAAPALVWNMLTGGSNSVHALYTPVRVAAATAKGQLLGAAAALLGGAPSDLAVRRGVITARNGRSVTFADVAERGAVSKTTRVRVALKRRSELSIVGTSQGRVDAREIVTGTKQFAMDIDVPGALPTMLCRAPTINGTPKALNNYAQVIAMPGVTDVALIPHTQYVAGGVAVRAATFGQCIDAIDAMNVSWGAGTADGKSAAGVAADLAAAELPLTPALGSSIEQLFTFHFRPGDPLETNCAVADVHGNTAEVWSSLKNPIYTQETIAAMLGLQVADVKVHVSQGGGSFGRHLFSDAAFEAAAVSQKMGKPVRLMWHRTDNFRQGRVHPMNTSRVRMTYSGANVIAFDQRHTSVATDFTHGFGEIITALGAQIPEANSTGYSETIFTLTANVPYNFGVVTQLLSEIYAYNTFNTSSVRNIYSPDVCTATELMVDQMAKHMGQDPYQFRKAFLRDSRLLAVLDTVAEKGNWGRSMPAGTAQGIGIHKEYKSACACLVEIDCTPATVNRPAPNGGGYTGPRVTKVVVAVDVGLAINVLGLEAQMLGGAMDGIAQALSYSLHLSDGHFLEGSWDHAHYTRQWNTPFVFEAYVSPPTTGQPGGAGELGVGPAMAAVACAYARATGTVPTTFPINHDQPLDFTPFPTVPPLPESLTDTFT